MFNRQLRERIAILEAVVDALLGLLIDKDYVTQHEIQMKILESAKERDEDG